MNWSGKKGSRERQSLIPVTVKQILTCENVDDVFRLDGAELFTVKIIGTVDSVAEHATNHTYQISDSTGSIECKLWIDKDSGGSVATGANTLVRICGSLREYEGRRHVLVYDMSRVEDWNELTHHMLGDLLILHICFLNNVHLQRWCTCICYILRDLFRFVTGAIAY
jgi:replication factor A2